VEAVPIGAADLHARHLFDRQEWSSGMVLHVKNDPCHLDHGSIAFDFLATHTNNSHILKGIPTGEVRRSSEGEC
jgi:hypothetical protein